MFLPPPERGHWAVALVMKVVEILMKTALCTHFFQISCPVAGEERKERKREEEKERGERAEGRREGVHHQRVRTEAMPKEFDNKLQ